MKRSDRKKQLLAEGAVCRAELVATREALKDALRPETLARSATHHLAQTAMAAVRGYRPGSAGIDGGSAIPLLVSGMSMLSGTGRTKKVLRMAVAAATAAGAGYAWLQARRAPPAEPSGDEETQL